MPWFAAIPEAGCWVERARIRGMLVATPEIGRRTLIITGLASATALLLSPGFQLPTFFGGVRTDCVVGIEGDFLSGIKSLTGEVPHGRDNRPLVGARARRMRVRGPAFGPALAQTHRAYGGRDRG